MTETTSLHHAPQSHPFGRRHARPVVIIQNQSGERRFTISPVSGFSVFALLFLMTLGLCASSAYLFLRDDLLGATIARHARMQNAYEDRISALRTKVDLVTSRQMLDQQAVESRVGELLARQAELDQRTGQMRAALTRAAKVVKPKKLPKLTPEQKTEITGSIKPQAVLKLGSLLGSTNPIGDGQQSLTLDQLPNTASVKPDETLFESLEASLSQTEQSQFEELVALKEQVDSKSIRLATILRKQGMRIKGPTGTGGPLIELKSSGSFLDAIQALDESIAELERHRKQARRLPHGSPAPGKKISSPFGGRKDPFTGRTAMHAGIDYRAKHGSSVRATASGVVKKAGRNGGYGKMVEIDHGNGLTTRYAHLSRILVKKGQRVPRCFRVGRVGSTGRSTGPHLHYEVRRSGQTVNPIHYVRLERYLKPYL